MCCVWLIQFLCLQDQERCYFSLFLMLYLSLLQLLRPHYSPSLATNEFTRKSVAILLKELLEIIFPLVHFIVSDKLQFCIFYFIFDNFSSLLCTCHIIDLFSYISFFAVLTYLVTYQFYMFSGPLGSLYLTISNTSFSFLLFSSCSLTQLLCFEYYFYIFFQGIQMQPHVSPS